MTKAWRFARISLGLAAALLAVTSLPYLYAGRSMPPDLVYTGLLFDVPDHAQYWSWVTESRAGLFISNTMTPEPNAPIFMNPTMWLLAQVQGAFGLSFPALFQVWRATAAVLLLIALVAFVHATIGDASRRRTALIVALLGSGFGWGLVVAKKLSGAADVPWPSDIYTVEPNTLFGLMTYPYQPFAQSFLLAAMLGLWWIHRRQAAGAYALATGAAVCLALFHAYDLLTVYAVFGGYTLVCWVRSRRFPTHLVLGSAMVLVASAPIALYYQRLTTDDPLWRSILSQYANAGVWTPRHFHLLILMGIPGLLAGCAALWPRRRHDDSTWLMITWGVVGLVLIYLPVVYQVKLLAGWQFPLAVLAAHAWHDRALPLLRRVAAARFCRPLLPRWSWGRQALAAMAIGMLVVPTNAYLFSWRFVELSRHEAPYYLHRDEVAALEWLAREGQDADVVLAPLAIGQFVPNYGESRAYLAHWAMTNRFYERRDRVAAFFSDTKDDEWRRELLKAEGVTVVLRAPDSGESDGYDPSTSPLFEPVFMRPRAQIFRVHLDPADQIARETGR